MKYTALFLVFFFISCTSNKTKVAYIVLQDNVIDTDYLHQINEPEKALLTWYLYAYGNECDSTLSKRKCKILKELKIEDECNSKHLTFLLQWFSNDMMASYKLNKCPNLPIKSAIQNTFEEIIIYRNNDTLAINFTVKGLNNSQEKSWKNTQIDKYLITSRNFVKIK